MKLKKKNTKKIVWWVLAIIAILSLVFFLRTKNEKVRDTYRVEKTKVTDELVFAGVVDAERRADLGFAVGGRVIKNKVQEGDYVKKGQILAEVDQSAVRASLAQAHAQYELTKVDNQIGTKDSLVSYGKLIEEQNRIVENLRKEYLSGDLRAYFVDETDADPYTEPPVVTGTYFGDEEGEYRIYVYRSGADSNYTFDYSGLESGTIDAEVYQPGRLGTKGLFLQFKKGGNYDRKEFIISIPNKRSPTYLARKAAYENALAKRDKLIAEAKIQKEKFIKEQGNFVQEGDYAKARLAQAEAQIRAQSLRFSDGVIRAPFDGYVVKNDLELGETAKALTPYITIFSNKKRKLVLNTPEIYVHKIAVGDDVDIILDAYPDLDFLGKITEIDEIDSLVDGVPVYETDVLFQEEDGRIRVGMNAHARIVVAEKDKVLAIPKHFIFKKDEKSYVYLLKDDDNIEEREIVMGMEGNDGLIEVISGLSEGDTLVREEE